MVTSGFQGAHWPPAVSDWTSSSLVVSDFTRWPCAADGDGMRCIGSGACFGQFARLPSWNRTQDSENRNLMSSWLAVGTVDANQNLCRRQYLASETCATRWYGNPYSPESNKIVQECHFAHPLRHSRQQISLYPSAEPHPCSSPHESLADGHRPWAGRPSLAISSA